MNPEPLKLPPTRYSFTCTCGMAWQSTGWPQEQCPTCRRLCASADVFRENSQDDVELP